MHIGDRLARQRKTLGLTQQALADKSGVRRSYIALLESHQNDNPTAQALRRLARALGVSIDYLVGLYDEEQEPAGV
jgi:transcriptional regulator with XRE-family HTH domain